MPNDPIIPPRKMPENEEEYFEILTKAVFQAGFSWKVVEKKWKGFEEVFEDFIPFKVSTWGEEEIANAIESPKIIRNPKKIEATVYNAKQFVELSNEFGSFANYIKSLRDFDYNERVKKISKQFKWLGKTGAFFFFYSTGEEVPDWHKR